MPKSPEERKAAISAAQEACRMADEAACEAREVLWQAEEEENKAASAVRRAAERKVRDCKVVPKIEADALALLIQISEVEIKVRAARLRRDSSTTQLPYADAHEIVLKCRKERAALAEALSALETQSPESVEVAWEEWAIMRVRKDEAGGVEENP